MYQANWDGWLKAGCNHLRNHPIFRELQTREHKEGPEICLEQQVGDLYQLDEPLEASTYDRLIGGMREMKKE